jgi:hypothetical protein
MLTVFFIALWCRVNVSSWSGRAAAATFPSVGFVPVARALDDALLEHKLNVFFWTVGSLGTLAFIMFLMVSLICIRRWKNKRFSVKCVRVPKEFVPEQDIPYVPGSEYREYRTVYSHLQTV